MATPPVAVPTTPPDASAYLANIVSDLHQHQVKVSYFFVGIIVLVLALAGAGGYLGLRSYEAQLNKAEAQQAQYQASLASFQSTLATNNAARAVAEAQVIDLQAQIAHRAIQPLPKPVQDGLKPDATAQEAVLALQSAYSAVPAFGQPVITPEGKVLTTVSQTQILIGSKVELDRTKADLQDEKSIASLQTGTINSLQSDLNSCKSTTTEANKVIDAYKKAATKSKFRRFMDGVEKVGLLLAGGIIGHAI